MSGFWIVGGVFVLGALGLLIGLVRLMTHSLPYDEWVQLQKILR